MEPHFTVGGEPGPNTKRIRFVCISDTHCMHHKIKMPPGDILIHAGDFAQRCPDESHIVLFNSWLGSLTQYSHKVVIAGNHEYIFNELDVNDIQKRLLTNCTYLQDSQVTIEGITMYGTPWNGSRNMAFSSNKDKLIDKWDLIPKKREDSNAPEVDILITHMPPYKLMDYASNEKHWGCRELRRISRHEVKPYVHIFGHVHEGHGYKKKGRTTFVNASIKPWPPLENGADVRDPIVFDYFVNL